jgi:hypothetical protein
MLVADYSISCAAKEERDAMVAYAIINICIWPVGTPALFLAILTANRKKLSGEAAQQERLGEKEGVGD